MKNQVKIFNPHIEKYENRFTDMKYYAFKKSNKMP